MRLNIFFNVLISAFLALGSVWSFRDGMLVAGCSLGIMSLGLAVICFYGVLFYIPAIGGTQRPGKQGVAPENIIPSMVFVLVGVGCAFFAVFVAQGGTAGSSSHRVPEGTGGAIMMAVISVLQIVLGIYGVVLAFTGKKRRREPNFRVGFASYFEVLGNGHTETVLAALPGRLKLIARDPFHMFTAPVANDSHLRQLRFGAYGDGVIVYHVDSRARRVTISSVTWSG